MTSGPAVGAERRRLEALLALPPQEAARRLIGQRLVRGRRSRVLSARIVETEAYLAGGDPAAHAWHGRTARTEPLWGDPGTWYVYLIYGIHHCLNLAVLPREQPGCVLIRAAEIEGEPARLASGPGRLTRCLSIARGASGSSAFDEGSGLWLREGNGHTVRIGVSRRIGIRRASERLLRFFDSESAAVSRPVPRGARARRGAGC